MDGKEVSMREKAVARIVDKKIRYRGKEYLQKRNSLFKEGQTVMIMYTGVNHNRIIVWYGNLSEIWVEKGHIS